MAISLRLILFILVLLSQQALGQKPLDYGPVVENKKFSCNDYDIQREESIYIGDPTGLATICDSKNEFEIRFFVGHRPEPDWDLFVITYNNGTWTAAVYCYDFSRKTHEPAHPISVFKPVPRHGFDSLFRALKQNHVFTLPDQRTLKFKGVVDDGNAYSVSFKVNSKFRWYAFDNPDSYKEENKSMKVFEHYDNIASVFYEELKKE